MHRRRRTPSGWPHAHDDSTAAVLQALCAGAMGQMMQAPAGTFQDAHRPGIEVVGRHLGLDAVVLVASGGPSDGEISTWIDADDSITGDRSPTDLLEIIERLGREKDERPCVALPFGNGSAVLTRVADQGPDGLKVTLGAIRRAPQLWRQHEVDLLQASAAFLTPIIESEGQRRSQARQALGSKFVAHCVSELAGASGDTVQESLLEVVRQLGEFYRVDRVGIWDVVDGGLGISATARWQADSDRQYAMANYTQNPAFARRLMETTEPRFLHSRTLLGQDLDLEDRYRPTALEVPLSIGGVVSGAVALASDRFRPWIADDVADIQTIATAISNVRLLATTERRFRTMFEEAPDGITLRGFDGTLLDCNQAYAAFLGYDDPGDLIGTTASNVVSDASDEAQTWLQTAIGSAAERQQADPLQLEYQRRDGRSVYALARRTELPQLEGERAVFLTHIQDVTRIRQDRAALIRAATRDELTGLHNRQSLATRLEERRSDGTTAVVVLLDLDRFKLVNDSLGSDAGDQVLTIIADRLRTVVRPGDLLARLGGDEYAVLMDVGAGQLEGAALAARILDVAAKPIEIFGSQVFTDASVGIAVSTPGDDTAIDVLRHADAPMYQAKDAGRGRYEIFDAEMRAARLERLALENDLRKAIPNDELVVFFQPEIDLLTGQVVGAEALVRWQHPTRGMVGPVDFIPIAEDSGLIVPLGRWVLEAACAQGATWIEAGLPIDHIRVNLSTIQMRDPSLLDDVKTALVRSGLPASRLCLEVTESAVMGDVDRSMSVLSALRDLGIAIAVDDFGTGFSSLAYLQRLPLDILKIDRSFIIDLGTDPSAEAIVTSIIGLARDLGLELVGEGVETELQEHTLVRLGCRNVQGYKYARPLPADEIEDKLRTTYKTNHGVTRS